MDTRIVAGLVLASLFVLPGLAPAQDNANCLEELQRTKLELAIADRATPLHDQAFQQAAQQLRKEVAGEWAKANQRADQAQQRAQAEKQRADELAKQIVAAKEGVPQEAPAKP